METSSDVCPSPAWICSTCGTQYPPTLDPPAHCPICKDDRQYVGWTGQQWTTIAELAGRHRIQIGDDEGVLSMRMTPGFGIDQRSALIPLDRGYLMWEVLSLVTDEAVAALRSRGGVQCIGISHPHFYASMHEWSEALGGVPIYLHEADRAWVQRPSPHIRYWSGDRLDLTSDVALLHLDSHFPGSAGAWWKSGPRSEGSLFPGDAIQVAMDRRHATFMHSYPNAIPLRPAQVRSLRDAVSSVAFGDVFGYSWGRNIIGGARRAVDLSFDRYLAVISE